MLRRKELQTHDSETQRPPLRPPCQEPASAEHAHALPGQPGTPTPEAQGSLRASVSLKQMLRKLRPKEDLLLMHTLSRAASLPPENQYTHRLDP